MLSNFIQIAFYLFNVLDSKKVHARLRHLQHYSDGVAIADVFSQGRNVNDTITDQSHAKFIFSDLNKEITQKKYYKT